MALATRCPACQTTFRVVADQLKLRQGLVRCGQCRHVFNGIEQMKYLANATEAVTPHPPAAEAGDTVESEFIPAPSAPSNKAPTDAWQADASAADFAPGLSTEAFPAPKMESISSFAAAPLPEAFPSAASSHALNHEAKTVEVSAPLDEAEAPLTLIDSPTADASDSETLPSFLQSTRRSWLITAALALGIVLSAALLTAQLAYFYRSDIAATFPQTRGLLQSACASLPLRWRCQVPPPQRLAQLRIADAEVVENTPPGHYLLRATLKNESDKPRAFPALDITLSNALNTVLARRVLPPDIYLSTLPNAASLLQQGLAPNKEQSITLPFVLSEPGNNPANGTGDKVAGYVVDIFYP